MPQADGVEALLSRLSFSASLRARQQLLYTLHPPLPVAGVAGTALVFCVLVRGGGCFMVLFTLSVVCDGDVSHCVCMNGLVTWCVCVMLCSVVP